MERKHPLLSRKFWVSVCTAVGMLVAHYTGLELDWEVIAGIVAVVVAYVLGESYIDAAHK